MTYNTGEQSQGSNPAILPTLIAYGRTSLLMGHGFSMRLKKCTAQSRQYSGHSLPSEESQIRHRPLPTMEQLNPRLSTLRGSTCLPTNGFTSY